MLFFAYLMHCQLVGHLSASMERREEVEEISRGLGSFTIDLGKNLFASRDEDNIVLSGYSAGAVLSMASLGSEENTRKEIKKALKLPAEREKIEGAYGVISKETRSTDNFTLSVANAAFVRENFEIKEEYKNAVEKHFHSEVKSVDFNSDGATDLINAWVEDKTNNKIKDLFEKGSLGSMTALVLVNAVYFKGDWDTKFNPDRTKDGDFYVKEGITVKVPLMHSKDIKVGKWDDDKVKATVLELPYKGQRISMFIVLPEEKFGLKNVISKIDADFDFDKFKSSRPTTKVDLTFPKFKIESTHDLKQPFKDLGLQDMFSSKADFSGIAGGPGDLTVYKAVQKAVVEVNEEGSEAAAASGMAMMMRSMPLPPAEVRVDHPFLFFIFDKKTGLVLFSGKVIDPSK